MFQLKTVLGTMVVTYCILGFLLQNLRDKESQAIIISENGLNSIIGGMPRVALYDYRWVVCFLIPSILSFAEWEVENA
jgi:hypothetical protein